MSNKKYELHEQAIMVNIFRKRIGELLSPLISCIWTIYLSPLLCSKILPHIHRLIVCLNKFMLSLPDVIKSEKDFIKSHYERIIVDRTEICESTHPVSRGTTEKTTTIPGAKTLRLDIVCLLAILNNLLRDPLNEGYSNIALIAIESALIDTTFNRRKNKSVAIVVKILKIGGFVRQKEEKENDEKKLQWDPIHLDGIQKIYEIRQELTNYKQQRRKSKKKSKTKGFDLTENEKVIIADNKITFDNKEEKQSLLNDDDDDDDDDDHKMINILV